MIVKGVFGKSIGSNFGVRATSPGAIGILSEIPALDLGSEGRFRFGHNCLLIRLLSVGRIDVSRAQSRRARCAKAYPRATRQDRCSHHWGAGQDAGMVA